MFTHQQTVTQQRLEGRILGNMIHGFTAILINFPAVFWKLEIAKLLLIDT